MGWKVGWGEWNKEGAQSWSRVTARCTVVCEAIHVGCVCLL